MSEKAISNLLNLKGRVYVYLADEETGKQFMQQAETEGFTFKDGVKPTQRDWDGILVLNRDMTLNYVGFVGHMAFGAKAKKIGNEKLLRVDFKKYAAGEKRYLLK